LENSNENLNEALLYTRGAKLKNVNNT
jgi:hypothetical protein